MQSLLLYLSGRCKSLSRIFDSCGARSLHTDMDSARYKAMDAQRFDPLRRTRSNLPSKIGISKSTMGQGLCVMNRPSAFPVRDTVGGLWPDHEVVVVPLSGQDSNSAASTSSYSTCTSDVSIDAHAPSPVLADFVVVPPSQTEVPDRDDLVITRTIIRPNRTPAHRPISRVFSSSSSTSSPHSVPVTRVARSPPPSSHAARSASSSRVASPTPSHSSRHTSPVLQALNCFSPSSAFENDLDVADVQAERDERPAVQVIVTQTREQYEDAIAFKHLVETVYPAAASRV